MAGHSKWANIRHKKSREDRRRAKIFGKLVREITVAARLGGGDPETNPRLRTAIQAAKDENMPSENIERAIKKGTGDLEGEAYEDFTYEGYGPGGAAILIEGLTDNRNRTAAELRHIFSKKGGDLAESGAVAWQFERRGLVTLPKQDLGEERLTELLIEVGAQDFEDAGDVWVITTDAEDLHTVADGLEDRGVEVKKSELVMIPQAEVELDDGSARRVGNLLDSLDDHDDVQKIWTNVDPEVLSAPDGSSTGRAG
ncbi:MAG: YebC/PmpR family DNA-binding transcriptional regulator [Thermoanaerobaculia bacterium]|nr:YebC/PmpR family DNA-binding transcriptional regulator [Thermoanaerobaculia bacterium]